ncbi:hypothetical protein FRACYDRAFT_251371 [Fragilariopsis cylindrus CCMP1102]|uniref:Uncharacterized protein n=1 Tax=Fragilariopsis cylindrus CCMP1102 TaxID=635003 RepID=A0A1E7EP05_9STRA|nr:hypothetical protein FRACYDRAFT_251371 [Fragilariopsis cylindrus CCMP1102]|eukprot:OEU07263.1 hypothetical protein FRACYDRAFT_251371 [Fragilariopsis cylindrus CCMP1102]
MHRVDPWTGLWGARCLGVETMVQFLLLLWWWPISEWYFWAWKYDMLAKMRCLCSGGKNEVNMRDHDPWFIPYWYEMDDWVVFWCTLLVLEPKEKFCEIKMIPGMVGGKHNVLEHYVDVSAPSPSGIVLWKSGRSKHNVCRVICEYCASDTAGVSSAPFQMRYLCSFD